MLKCGIALYTGGKDSHFAIMEALREGVTVRKVIIVVPQRQDSWMFHAINILLAEKHAELMGLKYLKIKVSGIKEVEIEELTRELKGDEFLEGCEYLVTGAVASSYQKRRVDELANALSMKHLSPLWGRDQDQLLIDEAHKLDFIVTAVQAYGLPLTLLGRAVKSEEVSLILEARRKYGVSPVGEGGEFETLVIGSPLFRGRSIFVRKARAEIYPNLHTGFYLVEDYGYF